MDQSDTPPPGLENLMRQQTSVTLKRVRGLGVLFVAVGRLELKRDVPGRRIPTRTSPRRHERRRSLLGQGLFARAERFGLSSGTRPTNYILSAPIEPTAILT
jgi:hypothetical protein